MNSCARFRSHWWRAIVVAVAIASVSACERGGEAARALRIGNQAEPASLDPHRSEGVPARNIQRDLFEGLVTEAPGGSIVPGVAERWTVSDDGRRWTFRLDPAARWSNGDPVTAGDFVFSLRRAVTPDTAGIVSETLLPIRNAAAILRGELPPEALGVRAADAGTLVIDLHAPTPYFLAMLTHPSTFPVHPASVTEHGAKWTQPGALVSNGAYRLVEWQVNSHIALERNPHYRLADKVGIERVEYLPIEDQHAELARFEAGDIHITYGVPPGRMAWLRENYPDQLQVHPWYGIYYLGLNTTRPPLDDARVRKALSMTVDRDILAREIAATGETPVWHWIHGLGLPPPEWAGWSRERRAATANELIAAAGYGESGLPELELLYNTRERDKRIVAAVAAMWRNALGVKTRLVNQEWKVYLQTRRQLDRTQVFRSGWIADYHDPHAFAEILHSAHGMNEFGWANARYDSLVEAAAATRDRDARFDLLRDAESEVQSDVPLIPLFDYAKARLVSDRVAGYTGNIMDHHYTRHLSWREPE